MDEDDRRFETREGHTRHAPDAFGGLEDGSHASAFASGTAAIDAAFAEGEVA